MDYATHRVGMLLNNEIPARSATQRGKVWYSVRNPTPSDEETRRAGESYVWSVALRAGSRQKWLPAEVEKSDVLCPVPMATFPLVRVAFSPIVAENVTTTWSLMRVFSQYGEASPEPDVDR